MRRGIQNQRNQDSDKFDTWLIPFHLILFRSGYRWHYSAIDYFLGSGKICFDWCWNFAFTNRFKNSSQIPD